MSLDRRDLIELIHTNENMKKLISIVLGVALFGVVAVNAEVEVTFESPENYRDIELGNGGNERGQKVILPEIEKYLIRIGNNHLEEGQVLKMNFTDIDLAGELEPWQGPSADHIRMMKPIYPPRLTFTYTLTDAEGAVLAEGSESLLEMGYDFHVRTNTSDRIYYEKKMLKNWMKKLTN